MSNAQQQEVKKVGDRIKVNACDWLETEETMGTILSVNELGYYVHCDDDDTEEGAEFGAPVDFNGDVYCDMP